MPEKWLNDNEDGGKNMYEEEFLRRLIQQSGKGYKLSFDKLVRPEAGRKLLDNMQRLYDADFSVVVYNFLDILSHARTETDIIRDLTDDEDAFRSLTRSWFEHSELYTLFRNLAQKGHTIIVTSYHGTIRVDNPVRVTGDKETSANLRYKTGRNLAYNARDVYEVTRPEDVQLPSGRRTDLPCQNQTHDGGGELQQHDFAGGVTHYPTRHPRTFDVQFDLDGDNGSDKERDKEHDADGVHSQL